MKNLPFTAKGVFLILFVSLIILCLLFFPSFFFKNTKIVFCDVGQGDAVYMRIKNKFDVVIDAGPDRKILECLGRHMPFYDRNIELAIITHPQKDHFGGFVWVVDYYNINAFILSRLNSSSQLFQQFKQKIFEKDIKIIFAEENMVINVNNSKFTFLWPSKEFLKENMFFNFNDSENKEFVNSTTDPNLFSLIILFQENNIKALFTGDISTNILEKLVIKHNIKADIFKVPHHGSKNGLNENILKLVDPDLSVICLGKNSYGHPSKEVLDYFKKLNKKYLRTDKHGDIVLSISKDKIRILN